MTTTSWNDVKTHAIESFRGELPNAHTEQALIDAFERQPLAVIRARDQVIEDFIAGKARSGWAVWKSRIQNVDSPTNPTVDLSERPKAVKAAEAWIHNAGGYIDREDELLSELFDQDIGKLRHWPDLKPRMLELWQSQRPRFIAAEAASVERQHEQAASLKRIRAASSTTSTDIDSSEHAGLIAAAVNHARYGVDPHRDDWLDQIAATHTEAEAA